MLLKVLGTVLLALSGAVAALSLRLFHRKRVDTLDGFISLIYYIKGQVDCYARPIGDIMLSLPPEILRGCNCPMGAASLEELIDESRIYLDREGLRLVTAFATEFGSIFREEQARRCDHYIAMLTSLREQIASRAEGEMRSGGAVCVCVALCLAILLW